MNVGLFVGHPAHYHYLKFVAKNLAERGHNVHFVVKKKDILEDLMKEAGLDYTLIRENRGDSKLSLINSVLQMERKMCQFIRKQKIDILVGSTLTFASRVIMGIPVLETGEDDAAVVPRMAKIAYPFASSVLSPVSCDNGKWNKKSIKYPSYQELAYLHPNHFTPDKGVVEKYFSADEPYFILRFAKLNAHHDAGIQGINTEIAQRLIDILKPQGRIYITSERELEPQFEQYRIKINPLDMHHVMAFASLYIGDSQTMAAEAAVLGTPFVRFNDFVGRIGYLRELEDDYQLGYGIKASEEGSVERLCNAVSELANLSSAERKERYQTRRQKMLSEKIDYAKFLTWFIENYPASKDESMKGDNEFWEGFK